MPDSVVSSLVIAHQLPPAFEKWLSGAIPHGLTWRGLAPEQAWDIPADATVLVAVPPRAGNVVVPAKPPAGWPLNLRWIHALSAGVDEFPKWIFDVPLVTCGRGANSFAIAEFVLAALLSVEKQQPNIWINKAEDWKPRELGTLRGKTLGLIGYGSIGQSIADLARPFGVKIAATTRSRQSGAGPEGVTFANLETVLGQADHLVIATPLTAATAGLIGRAALARVKPGVHSVNIARGRIIDHEALLEALNAGRVGQATLDVTEPEPLPAGHPLYTHPNVRISPHISWSAGERGQGAARIFVENLERYLSGQPLVGLVDRVAGY